MVYNICFSLSLIFALVSALLFCTSLFGPALGALILSFLIDRLGDEFN